MKDFDYRYKDLEFRIKPFQNLNEEEKSWIILSTYRQNILTSSDLQTLHLKQRLRKLTHFTYPIASYFAIFYYLKKNPKSLRFFNKTSHVQKSLFFATTTWWLFSKVNPFKFLHRAEKNRVMEFLDNNYGHEMLRFNRMLPRWYTENIVDGMIGRLYRGRNNFLSGWVFGREFDGFMKTNPNEYPSGDKGLY